jgi:RNA polymerase primary sigma factor
MTDSSSTLYAKARKARLRTPKGLTDEQRRRYEQIPPQVEYVDHPSFRLPETAERLFGKAAEEIVVPGWPGRWSAADEASSARPGPRPLSRDQEQLLFLRYNYARYRLCELAEAQRRRCSLRRARQMILWYDRAARTRGDLVRANMALVLGMAKRARICGVEFGELASEGNLALLRSTEKFDVSRGYKFSTYACRAILKAFRRLAMRTGRYRRLFPVEYDPALQRSDSRDSRHEQQWQDAISAVRQILARNPCGLTHLEQNIVMHRFALPIGGKGQTLAEIGRDVGLSNERVRQILGVALRKIRVSLYREYLSG